MKSKIFKLESPFRVISNETEYVYWVREVEVDKKGNIINYIIDNQTWSPTRFRGNKPNTIYRFIESESKYENDEKFDDLYELASNLEYTLDKIKDYIQKYNN